MSDVVSIVREKFPRLADEIAEKLPFLVGAELPNGGAEYARRMLALVPDESVDGVTRAVLRFAESLDKAVDQFAVDIGPLGILALQEVVRGELNGRSLGLTVFSPPDPDKSQTN